MRNKIRWILLAAALLGGTACGDDAATGDWEAYADKCAMPRTGVSPTSGRPYADVQGTLDDEKRWLKEWTQDLYLWYAEVPSTDPDDYSSALAYFDVLKTPALTASGKPRDQFHFTFPTDQWEALSQSGVSVGYGAQWVLVATRPPRKALVAYVEPSSPATAAGLTRGAELLTVDGVDVVNGSDVDTLNAGLFPDAANESHTFVVRDRGSTATRTITMTAVSVESHPVQSVTILPTPTGPVGYLVFNDHLATAEEQLIAGVRQFDEAQVTDAVIDLRYNGGGYLDIASELAFMLAGPDATTGKIFDKIEFNDQHRGSNPVTGQSLEGTPFYSTTQGFSVDEGMPLPNLGLDRVFVLTGPTTCSASEAIMNSLRGVDVEVIQIGATTCGKPYGFYPWDNCGTTYFSIQFQGVNDKGFGDYADGFVPGGTGPSGVPGCNVADDFTHELGDPAEGRLAAALAYRDSQTCPAAAKPGLGATDGILRKSIWQMNRISR